MAAEARFAMASHSFHAEVFLETSSSSNLSASARAKEANIAQRAASALAICELGICGEELLREQALFVRRLQNADERSDGFVLQVGVMPWVETAEGASAPLEAQGSCFDFADRKGAEWGGVPPVRHVGSAAFSRKIRPRVYLTLQDVSSRLIGTQSISRG